MKNSQIKVLMVCLGNICRSPTAEAVFRHHIQQAGLSGVIAVDSAGTSDWHVGERPDYRSIEHAASRGYDLSTQRSRQIQHGDFLKFDYVLAMDQQNLRDLEAMAPGRALAEVSLFLGEQGVQGYTDVPDPYSSGNAGFELVLDLVETASLNVLNRIIATHKLKPAVSAGNGNG